MLIRQLEMKNFRGVASGRVRFTQNTLLVGGNNVGKSTICEALDLALGPERLNRRPAIEEHDFYASTYVAEERTPVPITIRVILTDLGDEAERRFGPHLRRWNDKTFSFVDEAADGADDADDPDTVWVLPIHFRARYDAEEDDFEADTFSTTLSKTPLISMRRSPPRSAPAETASPGRTSGCADSSSSGRSGPAHAHWACSAALYWTPCSG